MDMISYSLSKKIVSSAVSGVSSMSVDGTTLNIDTNDGQRLQMVFPQPSNGKDGVSVTDIDVNANNQIVFTMSDGSEIISGKIPTVKGADGFSPTAKVEKVGDTATITITDKDGTTTATIKDGQGGTGGSGEENIIDSISVNGVNVTPDENKNVDITVPNIYVGDTEPIDDSMEVWINPNGESSFIEVPIEKIKVNGELQTPVNKVVDITIPDAYDDTALVQRVTDIESDYIKANDISNLVEKEDGKGLSSNDYTTEEKDKLASLENYNDTQVKNQIQTVANGLMDSVGYSSDYKSIDIIAKNGVKKSVNVAPIISHASIVELSDVDTTNKATGKVLVYNATTSKHEYADVSGTDEKVKMDASTDAKYLGELLDNITIANENGELKVKKLDGQEVTITEINYLKGLTMNVMDLVNMFSNGGVKIINTPVATYAELLTLDKSSFIEGVSYLVYVLADENHDNAKTTYLVDKDSETPTYFGFADSQRDFTTNPIDLATEITGKLGIANMDSDAIKALFTVDDTYKTETATNNAFSTHGAKALYDELLLAIGNKANDSDLTAHKDDANIHVSTEDRTKWDSAKTHADSAHAPSNAQENVLETVKVNGTALEVSDKAVNVTVPTTVAELTDSSSYAKKTDIPTTLPANGGNADTVNNHNVEINVPADAVFTDTIYDDTEVKGSIAEVNSDLDALEYSEVAGGKNKFDFGSKYGYEDKEKLITSVSDKSLSMKTSSQGQTIVYRNKKLENLGETTISFSSTSTGGDNARLYFKLFDANGNMFTSSNCNFPIGTYNDYYEGWYYDFSSFGDLSITFTMPTNVAFWNLGLGASTGVGYTVTFTNIQVEQGSTAIQYEPYIPSVKMLAEENEQQNTEAMDLKMLGWTVPSECPIQNEVSGNQFIQRVGRVDLGSLEWTYDTLWKATSGVSTIKNLTVNMYHSVYVPTIANVSDMPTNSVKKADSDTLWINNGSSTEKPSGYLYFELATEKTISVDGNEAVTKVNDSLSVIGKCKNLLNTTLQTTTQNGVTCTNNGDGTYTFNGTSKGWASFILKQNINLDNSKNHRLTGFLSAFIDDCELQFTNSDGNNVLAYDRGEGVNLPKSTNNCLYFVVKPDKTLNNVIIKPMITTNLNATYDDFVPYTGDGDTLTHDVAKLNDNLGSTDISAIGDGTVTGAISAVNNNLANKVGIINLSQSNIGYIRESDTVQYVYINVLHPNGLYKWTLKIYTVHPTLKCEFMQSTDGTNWTSVWTIPK